MLETACVFFVIKIAPFDCNVFEYICFCNGSTKNCSWKCNTASVLTEEVLIEWRFCEILCILRKISSLKWRGNEIEGLFDFREKSGTRMYDRRPAKGAFKSRPSTLTVCVWFLYFLRGCIVPWRTRGVLWWFLLSCLWLLTTEHRLWTVHASGSPVCRRKRRAHAEYY